MSKHSPVKNGARRTGVLHALLLLAWAAPAAAHEGHGIDGVAHWHATDVLGFVAVAAVAGAAVWWNRRK
jgi:hypothetical protein